MTATVEDELHYYATVLRQAGWTVKEPVQQAKIEVPLRAHDTQVTTVARMNAGTFREALLWLFINAETGWSKDVYSADVRFFGATDDEIETWTGRAHTTVSAARNTLQRMGLVYATEERRPTRAGNPAIVWRRTTRQALVQPKGAPRLP